MKKIELLTIVLFSTITFSMGQISEGGLPYSWVENLTNPLPEALILTPVNVSKSAEIPTDKHGALTFAEVINFNKSTEDVGEWTTLNNGDKLWRIRLKSVGAYSLNFTFSHYLLPEGAQVFIYSPDKKHKLGAFTHKNNKSYGILAVAPLPGDEIIVEYYEPEDAAFKGELTIGTIGHDFLNVFGLKDGQFGASDDCNIDINCPEGNDYQNIKRSVCRIVMNNSGLCTGTLVNNTSNNQEPFVLTALHCMQDPDHPTYTPANSVFFFNYESPTCNGTDGYVNQTISGAEWVAKKSKNKGYLDFALLRLSDNIPVSYKPYFAGWDSRNTAPTNATCIHHPWGDVKKVSRDFDATVAATYLGSGYDASSFWRVNSWDKGTTQGGSSGSPLFDTNKRIVGTLSGGAASCTNDGDDNYQMFSASYNKYSADTNQLKHWLDPTNTDLAYMDGLDAYIDNRVVVDLISVAHWDENQQLALYLSDDGGYLAGNNIYQDKAKAEFFNKIEFGNRNAVTGAYVAFGYAKGNNEAIIELQVLKDNFGTPSSVLGSSFLKLGAIKNLADKQYAYYKFDPPVEVNSSIYLSIVLPQVEGDTVAIMTVDTASVTLNTAWELNYYNNWIPYSDANSWGINLAHLISLEIGKFAPVSEKSTPFAAINLYPNPAFNEITIDLGVNNLEIQIIQIFDTYGRLVYTEKLQHTNNEHRLNISDLNSGFYVLVLKTNNGIISKKFIKE